MSKTIGFVGLGVLSLMIGATAPSMAQARQTAQSKSCWLRADQQGLRGRDRTTFHATCIKGSLAPKTPTSPSPQTAGAREITAPSGADRTTRSSQCNAEAARRNLQDSALQGFRKGCLASAAPVSAIESAQQSARPTSAQPKVENLTNRQPAPPR